MNTNKKNSAREYVSLKNLVKRGEWQKSKTSRAVDCSLSQCENGSLFENSLHICGCKKEMEANRFVNTLNEQRGRTDSCNGLILLYMYSTLYVMPRTYTVSTQF
jgi:hypothetical protein